MEVTIRFKLPTSNNQAEYKNCLGSLKMEFDTGEEEVVIKYDSQLVTSYVISEYQAKDMLMQ